LSFEEVAIKTIADEIGLRSEDNPSLTRC